VSDARGAASADAFGASIRQGASLLAEGSVAEARDAFERAIALEPRHAMARVRLADALVYLGDLDAAAAAYRAAIALNPQCGPAWWGLAAMRTVPFDDGEYARLRELRTDPTVAEPDHIAMGFALAKAHEDRARYDDAFATLREANASMRRRIDWRAGDFSARVDRMLAAFAAPARASDDDTLGREVIFVVSLPRSGSTLTEEILAAHPDVEGASELPDLGAVIEEESARRGAGFLQWATEAQPADWSRLGKRYLERTARWRRTRPRFTDKMPGNWLYLGAALAMLPGARIVDCRRDPVETCFSCYRQLFSSGAVFSYDLDDLAVYYNAYDRAMRHFARIAPSRIRVQRYEALLADRDAEIASLLAFAGLAPDDACRNYASNRRTVRTASAAQVRQPLRAGTARAALYGEHLAPLRRALGVAE
jgi:tetratricopeptide (TPR) repeat protein